MFKSLCLDYSICRLSEQAFLKKLYYAVSNGLLLSGTIPLCNIYHLNSAIQAEHT